MDASAGIVIRRGERNLRRVRIARGKQAVNKRRSRVTEDLLRTRLRGRLREVVILHRNHEHIADCCKQNSSCHAGEQCDPAPELSQEITGEFRRVFCVVIVI